jgi:hypothetical protein
MVGSELVGSLNAGERKDDDEGTLFRRRGSFRSYDRSQRGNYTRASWPDR